MSENFKYSIGIPEMDLQHQKLLELTNRTKELSKSFDEFEMNSVVMQLIEYAQSHLDQEEAFLKSKGLNDFLKEHIKKHNAFRDRAMEIYDQFRDLGEVEEKAAYCVKVSEFCETWLIQHINQEDRAYAELLKSK